MTLVEPGIDSWRNTATNHESQRHSVTADLDLLRMVETGSDTDSNTVRERL